MNIATKNIAPDVDMPVISIGCDFTKTGQTNNIVTKWLKKGGRGIDTSLNDGNQRGVAKAISEFKGVDRKDIFITTKVPNCNLKTIATKVDRDLKVLGTDYVDLLLIHHPKQGNCTLAWAELEKRFESKEARAIGVSNFGQDELEELVEGASVVPHLAQMKLNFFETHSEEVSYLEEKGITIQSTAPYGYGHDEPEELAIIADNSVIQEIADKYKVTPYQVAIKWILQHGWLVTFPWVKNKVLLDEANLPKFHLSKAEVGKLDNLENTLKEKIEVGTKNIAPGVDMPLISIGCDGLENHQIKDSVLHWLELGGRGIDTSLRGGNQKAVAKAINASKVDRKDIFITTKIPTCQPDGVEINMLKDLEQLGTDYVDLLLIHHPNRGNCQEAWPEMEKLFESQKVRAIGLSDTNKNLVMKLLKNATIVPHVAQMNLNVLETHHNVMRWFGDHNITVQSTAPLGRDMAQDLSVIADNPTIDSIAKAHKVTPYQVAIKWILQHDWLLTFEATRDVVEAVDADVMGFELNKKQMNQLNAVSKLKYYSTPGKKEHSSSKNKSGVGIAAGVGTFIIFALAIFAMKRMRRSRKSEKNIELAATDGIYRDDPTEDGVVLPPATMFSSEKEQSPLV